MVLSYIRFFKTKIDLGDGTYKSLILFNLETLIAYFFLIAIVQTKAVRDAYQQGRNSFVTLLETRRERRGAAITGCCSGFGLSRNRRGDQVSL